jgi:hypothetical protein
MGNFRSAGYDGILVVVESGLDNTAGYLKKSAGSKVDSSWALDHFGRGIRDQL